MCVRERGVQAQVNAQGLGRALGLHGAYACVTSCPGFALREIDDPHPVARLYGLGQSAATGQLDVVAVGGDGEKVHLLVHSLAPSLAGKGRGRGNGPLATLPRPLTVPGPFTLSLSQ